MVALSIAGIALLRSDRRRRPAVTGNLVLKQAASLAVDRGIERAVPRAGRPPALDRTQHAPAQNFYACVRGNGGGCMAGEQRRAEDSRSAAERQRLCSARASRAGLIANDDAGNRSCYVIERMCFAARTRDPQQLQSRHRRIAAPIPGPSITSD